jgi:hypothetical protein
MNLDVQKFIAILNSVTSVEEPDELEKLDTSVQQLLASKNAELGIDALLSVFERFPDKDGYGIFWSIVHGLEGLLGYQEKLVESVRRRPSEFSLLMIHRLLNAEIKEVQGVNLLNLLKDVATDERQLEGTRKEAQDFIKWHES